MEPQFLSRDAICAAAVAIIDRSGLPGLTMNAVGEELGVTGMAVYEHYPSKSALLDAVLDTLLSGLPEPPQGRSWREKLRALYLALWRLFEAHPNALPLVCTQHLRGSAAQRGADRARSVLLDGGLGAEEARLIETTLTAYALGFAGLATGGYPQLGTSTHTGATAQPAPVWEDAEREYLSGLEMLLRGVEARIG